MYSPGVCDVITIDLRYRGPLCMSHCVQCITRKKPVLPRKPAILRMRGFVVSMGDSVLRLELLIFWQVGLRAWGE